MPQISLYVDREMLDKITKAAESKQVSISKWVADNIKDSLKDSYSDDFFKLFGALDDKSFARQHQLNYENDSKRERI